MVFSRALNTAGYSQALAWPPLEFGSLLLLESPGTHSGAGPGWSSALIPPSEGSTGDGCPSPLASSPSPEPCPTAPRAPAPLALSRSQISSPTGSVSVNHPLSSLSPKPQGQPIPTAPSTPPPDASMAPSCPLTTASVLDSGFQPACLLAPD